MALVRNYKNRQFDFDSYRAKINKDHRAQTTQSLNPSRSLPTLYEDVYDGNELYYKFLRREDGISGKGQMVSEAAQLRSQSQTREGLELNQKNTPSVKDVEHLHLPYEQVEEKVGPLHYTNSNGQYEQYNNLAEGQYSRNNGVYLNRYWDADNIQHIQAQETARIFKYWVGVKEKQAAVRNFSVNDASKKLRSANV